MGKRILLVDDDAQILETAQDILETAGYEVQTAETGVAALEKLQESPVQLMIVDFNLADTTGIALALQAKAKYANLLIVMMTGEADIDLGAAKASIYAVLTKPVNPADLIQFIKQAPL